MSVPEKAFILAAGFGTRMKPLTDTRPKPMVEIAGRPLLDHILDRLLEVDIREVVVNAHHHGDQIVDWAADRSARFGVPIHVADEPELLETGGGVKAALPYFEGEPFYVIAGDAFWVDAPGVSVLKQLGEMWRNDMDALVILQDIERMLLTDRRGDYVLNADGRCTRILDKTGTHMFANMRINHPRIFEDTPDESFSFLKCMDSAEAAGRLFALEHAGDWHHISTPEDLARVNEVIKG